jgi:hypothetical protein
MTEGKPPPQGAQVMLALLLLFFIGVGVGFVLGRATG